MFDDLRSPEAGDRPAVRHGRFRHHHRDDRGHDGPGGSDGPGGHGSPGGPGAHGRRRGPGPGWGFPGGPGWGRGRTARRGDVRTAILAVLADQPMHGYQVINELESRSGGRWRPSAGSVYPTLAQLEDEGLVRSEQVEGRRVYSLTGDGRAETARLAGAGRAPWEGEDGAVDAAMELRNLVAQVAAATMQVGQVGSAASVDAAREILADTRRRLYRLLAEDEAPTAVPETPQGQG